MSSELYKFISELDAGVLEQKLDRVLRDVAMATINTGKTGTVALSMTLKQIGNTHQVTVSAELRHVKATANGKMTEINTTHTPMHVGSGGTLSIFREDQNQLFDKLGNINKEV